MFPNQESPESDFLQQMFSTYYKKHVIDSVPDVPYREFGFGVYKRKIANRNMAFTNVNEVNSFLRDRKPLFFSYSNAYYKFPARTPMSNKELFKADIIYEFDADELGLEVPVINEIQWFKPVHLEEAKRQVFRLLDFLHNDFGFSDDGVAINFSGKAGFHVHLRSKSIQDLNKRARIELVDYLTAQNMDFTNLGFDFDSFVAPKQKGLWQARLIIGLKEFFEKDTKEISKLTDFPTKKVSPLVKSKDALFSSLDKGVLMQVEGRKGGEFWKKVLEIVAKSERVPIDRQTSIDLHKIIRVPATLHGDTGMVAKIIPIDSLKDFDAFNDSVVFDEKFAKEFDLNTIKVTVKEAPAFELLNKKFGPYKDEVVELPLFAAAYLVGKGAAVLKQ